LNSAQTSLSIDQSDYFNFAVDDVDRIQGNPDVMDAAMNEAAYAIANKADQYIASLYTDVSAINRKGDDTTPISISSSTDAYDKLVDLSTLLTKQNVPVPGRWIIVPPEYENYLLKDLRFVGYGTQPNLERLTNGIIGRAAGFDILVSNNVPNTSSAKYKIIAGHRMAWSYANQVNQLEAYRPEKRFGDAMKGLHLYGAKVIRPNALALMTTSFA